MRRWPRPAPPPHRLRSCRIVSHRGEHDNRDRFENTLPAFDAAADAGVWGIEMDIRWTRDLVPVVFHDPDARRLFGHGAPIAETTLEGIKQRFPLIPTLAEVVERYGGRLHLMLEIKHEPYRRPQDQARIMQKSLRGLAAGGDYHLMGLHPEMFAAFGSLPPRAFVPIARLRIDRFSRLAAARGWGGLAAHYLLATRGVVERHQRRGQGIGTGFVDSRQCLFREVSRGVDWIFSNRAAAMQAEVGRLTTEV
ncbi:MAG TPA: glycerophosphodiester phosphodiesterase [Desulfosarcina sp.]|nr:glycerophosphodiester phosphodiesterase [Desulfosarcina sp.]